MRIWTTNNILRGFDSVLEKWIIITEKGSIFNIHAQNLLKCSEAVILLGNSTVSTDDDFRNTPGKCSQISTKAFTYVEIKPNHKARHSASFPSLCLCFFLLTCQLQYLEDILDLVQSEDQKLKGKHSKIYLNTIFPSYY